MNRESRTLKKVIYDDFLEHDIVFNRLMGPEVTPRKKFIIQNYNKVNTLDI